MADIAGAMTKTVLIVDDDPALRETLREMLQMAEYEVLEAANGKEALNVLDQKNIDALISDVIMSEVDGLELLMSARKTHPDLKTVLISGGGKFGNSCYLELARRFGANATLAKPFSFDELLHTMTSVFAQ